MASDLMMIVDDWRLPGLHYGGSEDDYNHTLWSPDNTSSLVFDFDGTSIAFIGAYPDSPQGTPTVITVDNMTFIPYSLLLSESTIRQWFQSPMLVDGPHSVSLVNCSTGTRIDFAIVGVGTQTNLTQSTIIVDDVSPSIFYSGRGWSRDNSLLNRGFPYGNSTHRSSTPGDTFTFWFTGTSVSVHGELPQLLGILSATYTLDGRITLETYNITSFKTVTPPSFNSLHYSARDLPAGNHTLIVNITEAKNHSLVLDFITYTPSFETLSSMPHFNNTIIPTTTFLSAESSHPVQVQTSGTSQPSPTAAIVGGVFGVLALGLFAILGRWLFIRRRKAKKNRRNFPIRLPSPA